MHEVGMVEGEEISQEKANRPRWTTALGKNKKARVETPVLAGNASHEGSKGGRRTAAPQSAIKCLAGAWRLPRLPRYQIQIIVRPRDALHFRKVSQLRLAQAIAMVATLAPAETEGDIVCPNIAQNILVVSTPEKKTQTPTPEAQLQTMIVNQRNPKALEARRIKNITTVVVLFDRMKVPKYVMCGVSWLCCTLYKRKTDVCYACHRAQQEGVQGLWARLQT
ncbi:hypothetical protein HPB52_025365 [Rhipicephalus sanguineus]|uniref:Uncharacterized protein n=1 Tax=Rhipicephalus sanguineus TaxID=34632 RepID=A0A9D4TD74_RHISA|nr:hypothetical protein HPB52_025365 [Rhipicephalus sanguineus]